MLRKLLVFVMGLCAAISIVGCNLVKDTIVLEGSGTVETISEDFTGFYRVEAGHAFDVKIEQGDDYSVEIRVDDNFVDYLDITKRGNTLDIDLKDTYNYRYVDGVLEASITMPELALVRLSGSSDGLIVGFDSTDRFEADISGASLLTGDLGAGDIILNLSGASELSGDYSVDNVDLNASGACRVRLSGSGTDVNVDASGNSRVNLEDFSSEDASVDVSGASEVVLNAGGTVDVDASGASRVYQTGAGNFGDVNLSGASKVESR
jgi:hypothetical protein